MGRISGPSLAKVLQHQQSQRISPIPGLGAGTRHAFSGILGRTFPVNPRSHLGALGIHNCPSLLRKRRTRLYRKHKMVQATEAAEKRDIDILSGWANDPDNAKNWSTTKKLYNTAVPAVLCFLMYVERSPLRLMRNPN